MGMRGPLVLTEAVLIDWHLHLGPNVLPDGSELHSTLTAPLGEVRQLAVRDQATGVHLGGGNSPSWMAAKGYLALIEQLGNAYDIDPVEPEQNPFKRSLAMFTILPAAQRETLWALRCSLFHDFALVRNERNPQFIFHVGPGGTAGNFIRDAARPWDGRVPADNATLLQSITTVELAGIGDLFETVLFPRVRELARNRGLRIRNLSLQEFQLKYFWMLLPRRP